MNDSKQAAQNQIVVDPDQVEKGAYRALAQVQQSIVLLSQIIEQLRASVIANEEAKKAEVAAKTGGK